MRGVQLHDAEHWVLNSSDVVRWSAADICVCGQHAHLQVIASLWCFLWERPNCVHIFISSFGNILDTFE